MPHVMLFEHAMFRGEHKHVVGPEPNLNSPDDDFFNDRVSSLAISQANWKFYRDAGYRTEYPVILGRGIYEDAQQEGIQNDDLSSLQPTTEEPDGLATVGFGLHVVLFEHINFHGRHRHILGPEPTLNAPEDSFFDNEVSSLVVLFGAWQFYGDVRFRGPQSPILGPGDTLYRRVADVPIRNDSISSLRPMGSLDEARPGDPIEGEVILFEHANFHGRHKHLFTAEPNLNAVDDSYFEDRVSSLAVVSGEWAFYRGPQFEGQYPLVLGPGVYPWVGNVAIQNDDVSSVRRVQ